MSETQKPVHPLASLGGIAGAIGGWTLSQYCGAALWIPGAVALGLFLLFTKTSLRPRYFGGAIAATTGHLVWFLVAGLFAGIWSTVGLDVVFLFAGVVWLWVRPGLA